MFLKQSLGLAECGMYLESDPNSWHAGAGFADRWHLKMGRAEIKKSCRTLKGF
jgi:hypothetical protein